jgi:hypothetical protein
MEWLLVLPAVIGAPELLAVLAFVFFAWDWLHHSPWQKSQRR